MTSKNHIDNKAKTDYHSDIPGTEGATDKLLTVQEVCNLLKVKETYVYWLTHQKKIPHIKMQGHLRFRASAIDEWLRSQEVC